MSDVYVFIYIYIYTHTYIYTHVFIFYTFFSALPLPLPCPADLILTFILTAGHCSSILCPTEHMEPLSEVGSKKREIFQRDSVWHFKLASLQVQKFTGYVLFSLNVISLQNHGQYFTFIISILNEAELL